MFDRETEWRLFQTEMRKLVRAEPLWHTPATYLAWGAWQAGRALGDSDVSVNTSSTAETGNPASLKAENAS